MLIKKYYNLSDFDFDIVACNRMLVELYVKMILRQRANTYNDI